jgi:hypothetical protein
MNNYIIISRTFCETDEESAEHGDFSDGGFVSEREEVSFRELVDLMRSHIHPSHSPCDGNTRAWFSTPMDTIDYGTGTQREESIHFHHDNTPNAAKYWRMAARAAGHRLV